ncbi:hypothetical protein BGZ94_002540 [Podila epigama]|nr:hypothetical protein BGZ94_002540 [Podila epigama]
MSSFRRQRPNLPEPARELITRVTGFDTSHEHFEACSNYVATQLFDVTGIGGNRNKSIDHNVIDQRIQGIAFKLAMKNQDNKADALKSYLTRLRSLAGALGERAASSQAMSSDTSMADQEEAAQNVVSSVLLVLLELSETPTAQRKGVFGYTTPPHLKIDQAPAKTAEQIHREMWQSILKEDPLVGEHWAQNDLNDQDSDDSDFEDMNVDDRIVPHIKDDLPQAGDEEANVEDLSPFELWGGLSSRSDARRAEQAAAQKALKEHQYWDQNGIVPRRPRVDASEHDASMMFDLQDASRLNRVHQASQSAFQNMTTMDELDIINEVFLLLQGLPTVMFDLDQNSQPKLPTTVKVPHLSQGALLSILDPFLKSAIIISKLQSEVDRICSAPLEQYGKIIQAFASAVHSELQSLRKDISDAQVDYQRYRKGHSHSMSSLIELESRLRPSLGIAETLSGLWKQCPFHGSANAHGQACIYSAQLLSLLYDNVYHTNLNGDTLCSALFTRLLQKCMIPFLNNIESWLSGHVLDSESEFIIKPSREVGPLSNDFWSQGFQYETEMVERVIGTKNTMAAAVVSPSFLSLEALDRLLYAGKAIRIIGSLIPLESLPPPAHGFATSLLTAIFGTGLSKESPPSLRPWTMLQHDPISSLQFPLPATAAVGLDDSVNAVESSHVRSEMLESAMNQMAFESRIETRLSEAIQAQYNQANTMLKSVLWTQCQLKWHLRGMVEFYFMLQGGTMDWFASALVSKMQRRRPWCDDHVLNSAFNQVATECNWPFKQFVKIKTKGLQDTRVKKTGSSLDLLRVAMLEQITFEYMSTYSRITTLLLQVKVAKLAVEQPRFLKFKASPSPTLGMIRKLRMRFLSTLNDLWSYLMTTVLDSQIKRFQNELDNQEDLDDIIALLQKTIGVCFERCFLKDRAQPLLRSLLTILDLALKFSGLFSKFIREQEQEETKGKKLSQLNEVGLSGGAPPTSVRHHKRRQGRRVSFTLQVGPGSRGRDRTARHEQTSSDSEENEDGGQDLVSDFEDRPSRASSVSRCLFDNAGMEDYGDDDDDDEEGDDDDGMDSSIFMGRTKKQRTGLGSFLQSPSSSSFSYPYNPELSRQQSFERKSENEGYDDRLPRSPRKKRPPQFLSNSLNQRKRTGSDASLSSHDNSQRPLLQQLQAVEKELTRCRAFLAKSLGVIVSANAARGYNASRRQQRLQAQGEGGTDAAEGDSEYLEALILALTA